MRALHLAAVFALLPACATTSVVARTRPEVESSHRALPPLPSRSVLVLGRATLGGPGQDGAPLAALERGLFDAGWDPMPKAALDRLLGSHRVAVALAEALDRTAPTALDLAAVLGPASTADSLLVVRAWRVGWAPAQGSGRARVCVLRGTLDASLHDRSGRLLWEAVASVRTSDLQDLTVTERPGAVELSHPGLTCVSAEGCQACAAPADAAVLAALAGQGAAALLRALPAPSP